MTLPSFRAQFTTQEATTATSFKTLVCGVPSVQGVQISSDMSSITMEIDVPLPSQSASDEMAFAILFGNLSVANSKLNGVTDLSMLDLVFDPSCSFGDEITDKCQDSYRTSALNDLHTYTDERTASPTVYGMIANSRCLSFYGHRTGDVDWTSEVHDRPDASSVDASGCNLGTAKWYLTFNLAQWTSAANIDALSVAKTLMNGGTKYTFPLRVYVTAVSKKTTLAETYYSPYQFEIFQKSSVFAALPVRETQMSGYRAHYLQNFVQVAGDTELANTDPLNPDTPHGFNLVKLDFDMVFFKEADHTALPNVSVVLENLLVKVQNNGEASPFSVGWKTGPSSAGIACQDIGDDYSSIATSDVTIVDSSDALFDHTIKSKDGTFYKQTLSVVCYLYVYRDGSTLFADSNDRVPLRFEYTHTYTDANTLTLMTDPVRDPIAIFLQQLNFQKITTFEYKTPLKGVIYKIPQEKIASIDQRTWTTSDVRSAMINAFASSDAPRTVESVAPDTPVAGAVTLKNSGDVGRYDIRLITAFLMAANKSATAKFVKFSPASDVEAPIEITNPCDVSTKHDAGKIVGFSTLFSNASSDAYTDRFSQSLRDILENQDGSARHVDNELFQINDKLSTNPFTQNYLLKEGEGAQDVLILPFLPKLRIADSNYNVDDYDITLCMVLEVDAYQKGVFSSEVSRKLLTVKTRGDDLLDTAETLGMNIAFTNDFGKASVNATTDDGNTTTYTASTDGEAVKVTVTKKDDYMYTNTNYHLTIAAFSILGAIIVIVGVTVYYSYKK
eukprot:gene47-69_t